MKRWSIVLSLFYLLALLIIWFPVIGLIFSGKINDIGYSPVSLIPVILIFGSALLIFLSVDTFQKRLRAKRRLRASIIATGFLLSLLVLGATSSILIAFVGDGIFDLLLWLCVFIAVALWITWGFIFHKRIQQGKLDQDYKWSTIWLKRGSVLELLIAVPSHIISRSRDDCCAPMINGIGICVGLSIMLFSFGPAILLLYKEKITSKQVRKKMPPDSNLTT